MNPFLNEKNNKYILMSFLLIPICITFIFIYFMFIFMQKRNENQIETFWNATHDTFQWKDVFSNEKEMNLFQKRKLLHDQNSQILSLLHFGSQDSKQDDTKQNIKDIKDYLFFVSDQYIQYDISKMFQLRNDLLDTIKSTLYSSNEYILFFDKPQFEGKMYIIPVYFKKMTWQEKDGKEDIIKEEFMDITKKKMSFTEFVNEFKFYFTRKFSVRIPQNMSITITSYDKASNESKGQTFHIKGGVHSHLEYNLTRINSIDITN